jgi:PhnB protein
MASDGHCQGKPSFEGFSLSLALTSEAEADRLFAALAEGGEVRMPIGKCYFWPTFGVLPDRYCGRWRVCVVQHGAA